MRPIRPLALALSLVLLSAPAFAQDLVQTYELARAGDPQLSIAESQRDISREGAVQARAQLLPQIGGSVGLNRNYEAGRDGFWLHRFLASIGVDNLVVDPASIEKPRKHRAPKTDRLDAQKLLTCLMRHWRGEKQVWGVARVPTEAEEDERRLHRESERLHKERSSHMARIKSLLVLHGIGTRRTMETFPC